MALKHPGPGGDPAIVHRWDHGLTWIAHPTEQMQRASHALAVEDDVWLIDPLDARGLDGILDELGEVAGVVVLTNSHGRDADTLADRYDVAIHTPACFDDARAEFAAPVVPITDELAATGFDLVWEKDAAGWKEGALYHADRETLVVADTLMTSLFTDETGRLELFPFFRLSPPRDGLGGLAVDRVLVGHGEPVVADAEAKLDAALADARRGAPSAIARALPTFGRIAYHEIRG